MKVCVCECVGVWEKPRDRCKEGTNSTKCSNTTDMTWVCVDRVNATQTRAVQARNVVVSPTDTRLAANRTLLLTSTLCVVADVPTILYFAFAAIHLPAAVQCMR